jgi:predicted O-methyltransferase YrrM
MEVLQIPSELEQMVALYREKKPKRVLEIGCWDGGTLREWLTHAAPHAVVHAIDPEHRNEDAYDDWVKPDTVLTLGYGLSQSPEMIDAIRKCAPYDWAFIDGDHGYGCVRSDVDVCLPCMAPGGVMLLHDVTPAAGETVTGPGQVLAELQAQGYETEVFDVPDRYPWSAGIGVVYVQ